MMWLTWRQFRLQAIVATAALAAFAIALAVTGPQLASLYRADGMTTCGDSGCAALAGDFLSDAGSYQIMYGLCTVGILLAPALIGLFWGAPLITREFETGTFRLAWTQTITRTRWLASKLVLPGLAAMAVAAGLSLLFGWWAAPIGQAARLTHGSFPLGMGPFSLPDFDAHGIAPLGYAAFAFTLGVTAGMLIRRTIPAMAVTLAIFAAIQVAMPLAIRPHLFPPARTTVAIGSFAGAEHVGNGHFSFNVMDLPSQPGAWIISSQAVNAAGQSVSSSAACEGRGQNGNQCLARQGVQIAVTYEPTSRFWPMQLAETGIYLALAMVLAGYCLRRLSLRRY